MQNRRYNFHNLDLRKSDYVGSLKSPGSRQSRDFGGHARRGLVL